MKNEDWPAREVSSIHRVDGARWTTVCLRVRCNATGEIREAEEPAIIENGDDSPQPFYWEDGNGGCDCNRSLIFDSAGGVDVDEDQPCGEGAYSLQVLNPVTREVFYDELQDQKRKEGE